VLERSLETVARGRKMMKTGSRFAHILKKVPENLSRLS